MLWKDAVNSALLRSTGYALAKDPEAARRAIQEQLQAKYEARIARLEQQHRAELRAKLAAQRERIKGRELARRQRRKEARERRDAERAAEQEARVAEAARARAAGEHLPAHYDDETKRTILAVEERTMTSPPKLHALIEAVRYVHERGLPGEIVECGVWRGGSMMAIATTLAELGDTTRDLHLYDTFEGMPAPTAEDVRVRDGRSAAELLAEGADQVRADAGLDDVRAGMTTVGYPAERIHYHRGRVEDTIPSEAPDQIALLRLDTDWYASTKHELEHLWDRLTPGGILILDDFGYWEGARKATLEWMSESGNHLFLAPMASGRIAVKPA